MRGNSVDMLNMRASVDVVEAEEKLAQLAQRFPGTAREWTHQGPLFLPPHILRRMLFFNDLYQKVLTVPGVVMEFGVRFGRDLAVLDGLRTLHEPLNSSRTIIGFDTFTGFPAVSEEDGALAEVGGLATTDGYSSYLDEILAVREQTAPFSHIRKFELRVGDAVKQLSTYLQENPQTVVAFAYFDLDLYEPTKRCLELLRPHLTRGSVVGFDELNSPEHPGETQAVREVFGLDRVRLQRTGHQNPGWPSFMVLD